MIHCESHSPTTHSPTSHTRTHITMVRLREEVRRPSSPCGSCSPHLPWGVGKVHSSHSLSLSLSNQPSPPPPPSLQAPPLVFTLTSSPSLVPPSSLPFCPVTSKSHPHARPVDPESLALISTFHLPRFLHAGNNRRMLSWRRC